MPFMDMPAASRPTARTKSAAPIAIMIALFVALIALMQTLEHNKEVRRRVLTLPEIQKAVTNADRCEKDLILSQTDGQDLEHLRADVVDSAKASCAQSEAAYAESETDKERNAMIYQALKD